jgi:hypothetical protein
MRGIDVETGYAFVSQETYHIRLSSITVDKKKRVLKT